MDEKKHLRGNTPLAVAVVVACLVLVAAGSAALADAVTPFGPPGSGRVTVDDMALLEGASGAMNDKYTIEARFKGGATFYFSIHHRNFGVGGPTFEVKSRYRAADGTEHRTRETLSPSEWSMSRGRQLELRMGRHRLQGTPRGFTVIAESDEMRAELTFKATTPAWRPGAGRAYFGGRTHFLDMTVLAPRAKVTGTIRIGDETTELRGTGYALHSYSNMAPHDVAKRMIGFRTERGKLALYFKEIVPADRWEGEPLRWLLVARRRDILFQSTSFELEASEFKTDTAHPNQYRIPRKLVLHGREGDTEITITITARRQRSRTDRLASLSSVERALASRFAKPVSYSYQATYEVALKTGDEVRSFTGRGIYELDHINK